MKYKTDYDKLIQSAHKEFNLPFDWLVLKAQLIAESNLRPDAISYCGAKGLAQFMPDTFAEVADRLYPTYQKIDITDPEQSIRCCAYYMASLHNKWQPRPGRTELDRYRLALASYNAGMGNVLKAQVHSGNKVAYEDIISFLPGVTGKANAKQTTGYVGKISRIWYKLKF